MPRMNFGQYTRKDMYDKQSVVQLKLLWNLSAKFVVLGVSQMVIVGPRVHAADNVR